MYLFQIRKLDSHHRAPDDAAPTRRATLLRANPCVPNGFIGRGERKTVIPVCELEELAVFDDRPRIEALHLTTDSDRKAAGIEAGDRSNPATANEESLPHGRDIVPERSHGAQSRNRYPA
jgi:hypothetical protein